MSLFHNIGNEEIYFEEINFEKDEIEKEREGEKVDYWIDLYTFLFEKGIILLSDELNREKGKIILGMITYRSILDPSGEFHLVLNNCDSGCLRTAITLYDGIQELPRHGHTLAYGMTASVGSLILVSGQDRLAPSNARILIEEPKWKFKVPKCPRKRHKKSPTNLDLDQFPIPIPIKRKKKKKTTKIICDKRNGKKDEKRKKRPIFRSYVDFHEDKKEFAVLTEYVREIFVSKTGQPYDIIKKDLKKNVVMSAEQAQYYGIIDRIGIDFKIHSLLHKTNLHESCEENGDDTPGCG